VRCTSSAQNSMQSGWPHSNEASCRRRGVHPRACTSFWSTLRQKCVRSVCPAVMSTRFSVCCSVKPRDPIAAVKSSMYAIARSLENGCVCQWCCGKGLSQTLVEALVGTHANKGYKTHEYTGPSNKRSARVEHALPSRPHRTDTSSLTIMTSLRECLASVQQLSNAGGK
jgi:hypothetical protein